MLIKVLGQFKEEKKKVEMSSEPGTKVRVAKVCVVSISQVRLCIFNGIGVVERFLQVTFFTFTEPAPHRNGTTYQDVWAGRVGG